MNLEAINKWLDEEYGCSYTRLEELHDFYFEKYCDLKKEIQELKEKLDKYENPEDMTLFAMWCTEKVKDENEKLKKKYENAVADYETTRFEKEQLNSLVNSCQEEIRQLKKQLITYKILHRDCKVDNLKNISKIEEMENQQKEFIDYMENEINYIKSYYSQINGNYMLMQPVLETLEKNLSKFKEIIGDDK